MGQAFSCAYDGIVVDPPHCAARVVMALVPRWGESLRRECALNPRAARSLGIGFPK